MSTTTMAARAGQPVPFHVILDPAGDVTLRIYHPQRGTTFIGDDGVTLTRGQIIATYKITKKVLVSNSKFFSTQFSTTWSNDGQTTFDLGEEHDIAFGIWLRVLHNVLNDKARLVKIDAVWHAVQLSKKYLLPVEKLNNWFDQWLRSKGGDIMTLRNFDTDDLRYILFLCHELESAQGFATVTRRLAYEAQGHITEGNPTPYRQLHLPNRIIGALNAARGNLKTQIHKEIYRTRGFLTAVCSCHKDGLFAYELALDKTNVWPLEEKPKGRGPLSVKEILAGLKTFTYVAPNATCPTLCSRNYDMVVAASVRKVQSCFEGLCLDCLDDDQERDWDHDYDNHADHSDERRYDENCRINHGQPSFYFSWIGRKQVQNAHEKAREERKRKAKEHERRQRQYLLTRDY